MTQAAKDVMIDLPDYRELPPAIIERRAHLDTAPVVLDLDHIGKVFASPRGPVVALRDINLDVHQREFIAIIGQSGCGKSTLIRTLAGLETPSSGAVKVDGKKVSGPGPDRGMVFQSYTLFPWRTVLHNVRFGLEMGGASSARAESEARQWIEMVGLNGFADHYPHQLSGGMRQRVAIARALANQPRILLMDEPFGALDAQTRCKMQTHLLEIWRKVNITILFITHDLDEAILLADRIVVLGARPGHIQEVITVPVNRPRTMDQMLSPAFLATKRRLEHLIHPPEDGADDDSTSGMPSMTPQGDAEELA